MRRVVLAGLLARSPRALILDEPLAGLDAASQRGLLRLLQTASRRAGLTVVVISHDFAGLEELCPRMLHLRDGVLESATTAGGGHVMTAPTATHQRRPGGAVAARCRAARRSTTCGRARNSSRRWPFGVLLTFYPGWVPIALVAALVLDDRAAGAYSARRAAVGSALAVDPAVARRCDRGVGRRQSRSSTLARSRSGSAGC